MLRFIFIALLVLLGGVLVGQFVLKDAGYILISYAGGALETSIWTGLFLLFACFILLLFCYRLFFGVVRLPHSLDSWWRTRTKGRTERLHVTALLQLASGNVARARNILGRSPKAFGDLILAYESALMAENYADAESLVATIRKSSRHVLKERILFELMMARIDAGRGDYARAFAVLNKHIRQAKRDDYICRLYCDVCVKGKMWDPLGDFLSANTTMRGLDKESLLGYYQLYFEGTNNLKQPQIVWNALTPQFRKPLLTTYVRKLISTGADDTAEEVMRTELQKNLSDELLRLYGEVRSSRTIKQLHFLDGLAEKYPRHKTKKTMLLTLAELCLQNKMWAQANGHYENLLEKHAIDLEEVLTGLKKILKEGNKKDKSLAQELITKSLAAYST